MRSSSLPPIPSGTFIPMPTNTRCSSGITAIKGEIRDRAIVRVKVIFSVSQLSLLERHSAASAPRSEERPSVAETLCFFGATVSGAEVEFDNATFSAVSTVFHGVTFGAAKTTFAEATFSGESITFVNPNLWDPAPTFDWNSANEPLTPKSANILPKIGHPSNRAPIGRAPYGITSLGIYSASYGNLTVCPWRPNWRHWRENAWTWWRNAKKSCGC